MVAFAKLQELVSGRPITYPGTQFVNAIVFAGAVGLGAWAMVDVRFWLLVAMVGAAALFGILFVLPIGGADMPVVISLLNAFTGLAAAATGFVLHSNVLIVSGMLVGASGTLLTMKMGRAMNRSIANVLFGAFGKVVAAPAPPPPEPTEPRCERRPRTTSRSCSPTRSGSSSFRATAWPSPRRSTRCASSPSCSSRRAST